LLVDRKKLQTPLIGALTSFEACKGEHTLLLPCDTPLISAKIAEFLFDMCLKRSAAIPRWPNGYLEPLQAVYHTNSALDAAKNALDAGKTDMRAMIDNLQGIRYISTLVLEQIDPCHLSFFNVNTPLDLQKAEAALRRH